MPFVKELLAAGGTSNKVAGTTLAATFTGSSAAGNLIVAVVLFDNAATASKPVVSSISKMAGETANWVLLGASRSTSTSAGAFASAELWCIKTTVAWTTPTITVTLDTSTVMKAVDYYEFSAVLDTPRSTAGTAYSTTTTAASAATTGTTPSVSDLAVGFNFQSNSVTTTSLQDSDTTGGSWSFGPGGGVGSSGGNATTNNIGLFHYKILTAASHQTLNAAVALTAGNGSIVAILQQAPPAAPTARTISAAAGTPAQTAANLTWTADTAANPAPTYLIERSADGSTGWTTVASGQTGQTGYNVTGLLPSSTNYFRVTGSNTAGSATSNVAGPITTTAFPKASTFSDDFTSLAAWTTVTGTPTVSGSNLQLDYSFATLESTGTTTRYDLTGSSVFFKPTPPPVPATATRLILLQAFVDSQNYISVYLQQTPTTLSIGTDGVDAGVSGIGWTSLTVTAAQVTYLRLSHSGLRFDVSYSTDGTNWTVVGTGANRSQAFTDKFKNSGATIRLRAEQTATDTTDPQIGLIDSVNIGGVVAAGGQPKVYLAGAFTPKPLKVWTGAAWATKPVKVWTGSAWKTLT